MTKTKIVQLIISESPGRDTKRIIDIAKKYHGTVVAPRTVQNARKLMLGLQAKAEELKVSIVTGEQMQPNLEYICEGCPKADTNWYTCTVYREPPSMYVRHGCCPFNRQVKTKTQGRKRVGQQKQRRF